MNRKSLTLVCCSYRRFDLLQRMVASAEAGTKKPDQYILLSNGGNIGSVRPELHGLTRRSDARRLWDLSPVLHVEELPRCSVAHVWNKAIQMTRDWGKPDYMVVTGDDVVFGQDTLRNLTEQADAHPEALFVYPRVMQSQMFCVYLAKQAVFDRVGRFDERFFPAYFEDNDFCRRMRLAGIEPLPVDGDGYLHDVSSTLAKFNPPEMEEHHTQFRENERKYVAKWGGLPGHEIYDTPMA